MEKMQARETGINKPVTPPALTSCVCHLLPGPPGAQPHVIPVRGGVGRATLIRQGIGGSRTIGLGRKGYQYWLIETGVKASKFGRMYTGQANSAEREEREKERERGGGKKEIIRGREKRRKTENVKFFTFLISGNKAGKNSVGV